MNITQFAQSRGVDSQVISRYIARHQGLFKGKTSREGKNVVLSDEAIEILGETYPLPKPVEILEDKESRLELIKTQKLVIQLQEKISEQQELISEVRTQQYLIEVQDEKIEEQKKALQRSESEKEALKSELLELRERLKAADERENRMKNASLWQRIRRKW